MCLCVFWEAHFKHGGIATIFFMYFKSHFRKKNWDRNKHNFLPPPPAPVHVISLSNQLDMSGITWETGIWVCFIGYPKFTEVGRRLYCRLYHSLSLAGILDYKKRGKWAVYSIHCFLHLNCRSVTSCFSFLNFSAMMDSTLNWDKVSPFLKLILLVFCKTEKWLRQYVCLHTQAGAHTCV